MAVWNPCSRGRFDRFPPPSFLPTRTAHARRDGNLRHGEPQPAAQQQRTRTHAPLRSAEVPRKGLVRISVRILHRGTHAHRTCLAALTRNETTTHFPLLFAGSAFGACPTTRPTRSRRRMSGTWDRRSVTTLLTKFDSSHPSETPSSSDTTRRSSTETDFALSWSAQRMATSARRYERGRHRESRCRRTSSGAILYRLRAPYRRYTRRESYTATLYVYLF